MPYVVTTKNVSDHRADVEALLRGPRAVATLEEARDWLYENVDIGETSVDDLPDFARDVEALPESGGTVGPLPDGTVIEVEAVGWVELADRADCFPVPWSHEKIIDAYNAREANA